MKNERRKSFILYLDNSIILDQLTDEESGKLIKAIFKYQSSGVTPDFSKNPALAMGFSVFKMSLDRDSEKYQERCEKNRANGKKGGIANATNRYQTGANASKRVANQADNGNDSDNGNDIDNGRINYKEVVETFNTICVSYPKVKSLSEARKKAIQARLRTYSMDDLKRAFEAMEQSEFLKGNNSSDWSANFDWVMKDRNLAKVLDGNYKNKEDKNYEPDTENRRQASDYYKQFLRDGTGN
jgi:hypothetical protein